MSQTVWTNLHDSVDNRSFTIIRSSRGGTTGEDHRQGGYPSNNNTLFYASQRYDDPNFAANITRATIAGIFAGPYHFARPDILANTKNSDGTTTAGVDNNGTDEANHFMQMAGPWMRPGYIVPMYDFEAGQSNRTADAMAQFSLDFSNRIYQVMGIRTSIYSNGSYMGTLQSALPTLRDQLAQPPGSPPSMTSMAYPVVVSARWPAGSGNPYNGDIQHEKPSDTYTPIYGPWDDYGNTQPWSIWQYSSGNLLQSYPNRLDVDVAAGGTEFFKDALVPAVWMNDNSGDWGTLSNWNSGQTPVAPPHTTGQLTPVGTSTLPTPRHPGDAGSGPTSGQNDTVILERPNANITVTLSSGSYDIRKLYVREQLNITGGSLNVNYVPVAQSTPISAQFSAPVSVSGGASFSVHTLQVDANQVFTVSGASLSFNTINLARGGAAGGMIQLTGDATITPLGGAAAQLLNSGSGSTGALDLGGGTRTITVNDGAAAIDLETFVPIQNGGMIKSGAGRMRMSTFGQFTGPVTVANGVLILTAANDLSGATAVSTTVTGSNGGTLQLTNSISITRTLGLGGSGATGAGVTQPGNIGALDSASGVNTWGGTINLNGTSSNGSDPQLNLISAAAGSTLVLSGVMQNGTGSSWAKTGDGDVVLTGAASNTYTNLTRVFGGRLIIESSGALGAGDTTGDTGGNTFQLAGSNSTIAFRAPAASPGGFSYSSAPGTNPEWIHLDGNGGGSPGLGQLDNLGGNNTFNGSIGLNGTGATPVSSIGVSAGSLEITGGIFARAVGGSARILNKLGTGTLILSGDSNPASINSSDVALTASTFNVTAGTVRLKSPTPTKTNMAGMTTWNVGGTGPASVEVASGLLQTTTLNVNSSGQVKLLQGGGKTLRATTVAFSADGKIDLADNKMIVDHSGASPMGVWTGSAYTGLLSQIVSGRNGGAWSGNGISTSMTAAVGANPLTTIGIAEASSALGLSGAQTTTWKGQSVDATTVLMLYTYAGDANLSGRIDADDYFQIDSHYNKPPSTFNYSAGDFNYDGKINGDDFFLIDSNFTAQTGTFGGGALPGGVSTVPEPAAFVLMTLPMLTLLRRRRRLG